MVTAAIVQGIREAILLTEEDINTLKNSLLDHLSVQAQQVKSINYHWNANDFPTVAPVQTPYASPGSATQPPVSVINIFPLLQPIRTTGGNPSVLDSATGFARHRVGWRIRVESDSLIPTRAAACRWSKAPRRCWRQLMNILYLLPGDELLISCAWCGGRMILLLPSRMAESRIPVSIQTPRESSAKFRKINARQKERERKRKRK